MKNEEFDGIITLTDENGEPMSFELLDVIEHKGEDYVVLFPVDAPDDSDVVILRMTGNEEMAEFFGIENEETLNAVYEIFQLHLEAMLSEFEVIE